jgi:hypothetical protein
MEALAPLLPWIGIAALCWKVAADKGRRGWVWGLVGLLLPLIGLVCVLFLRRIPREQLA